MIKSNRITWKRSSFGVRKLNTIPFVNNHSIFIYSPPSLLESMSWWCQSQIVSHLREYTSRSSWWTTSGLDLTAILVQQIGFINIFSQLPGCVLLCFRRTISRFQEMQFSIIPSHPIHYQRNERFATKLPIYKYPHDSWPWRNRTQ